jgi:NAD(P)-dependent dehydrogenase (short-subunit alcohol dehydrogenase family)
MRFGKHSFVKSKMLCSLEHVWQWRFAVRPWAFDDVPEQTGRAVIVTGANAGSGFETARMLALKGASVVLACRSAEKGQKALERIQAEKPAGSVSLETLDLADLESVSAFAKRYVSTHSRLDLLINNAGLMIPPLGRTHQGFELQFGTNHLGHFALTAQLLPLTLQTRGARIVVVTSSAQNSGKFDFDDLNWERKAYKPWPAYSQSKLATTVFALELQRRLHASGADTLVTLAHPGATATELQRNMKLPRILQFLGSVLSMTPPQGALPTLRAATDPSAQGGSFWGPSRFFEMSGPPVPARMPKVAMDTAAWPRLWGASEKLTGVSIRIPKSERAAAS